MEDAAIKESEKQFPYNDFRGKEKGVDDEHTGQALRGACVGGFEAGCQQKEQQLLPINVAPPTKSCILKFKFKFK